MAHKEVLIWPDPKLRTPSEPVQEFGPDLKALVNDMLETMYSDDGIGLAAPQIGVKQRVVVIDIFAGADEPPPSHKPLVIVNPEFVEKKGTILWEEGCLSIPGETGEVKRANQVRVKYQDIQGKEQVVEAEELLAVALQHESDHLDGVLFVDHLSKLKRDVIRRKMIKLKQNLEQPPDDENAIGA